MKKRLLTTGLTLSLLLTACGPAADPAVGTGSTDMTDPAPVTEVVKLTPEEAYNRMNSGDPVLVVDVRTAEEYAENHIPGALLLPNEDIGDQPPAQLPVLSTEILLYCRSGNRSNQAAKKLMALGYTNVSDFGGITVWPYETEAGEYHSPAKEGTLSSFAAYDLNGLPVDESLFADYDLTMINIWATFCGPCLREMPELGQLAAEYAPQGVQIIGLVTDVPFEKNGSFSQEMVSTAQSLVAQTGAAYPHLLPSGDLISAKLKDVRAVPETIFVDSTGALVGDSYLGARSGAEWAQIISQVLAEVQS